MDQQQIAGAIVERLGGDTRLAALRAEIERIQRQMRKLERAGLADCDVESLEGHLTPDGLDETGHQVVASIIERSRSAREYFALLVTLHRLERRVARRSRKLTALLRAFDRDANGPAAH